MARREEEQQVEDLEEPWCPQEVLLMATLKEGLEAQLLLEVHMEARALMEEVVYMELEAMQGMDKLEEAVLVELVVLVVLADIMMLRLMLRNLIKQTIVVVEERRGTLEILRRVMARKAGLPREASPNGRNIGRGVMMDLFLLL